MAVTLRLYRMGKKNSPVYRIVAIDKRKKRNGTYVDIIGFYNPVSNPSVLQTDQKKIDAWLKKGATISEGLTKLLKHKRAVKKD